MKKAESYGNKRLLAVRESCFQTGPDIWQKRFGSLEMSSFDSRPMNRTFADTQKRTKAEKVTRKSKLKKVPKVRNKTLTALGKNMPRPIVYDESGRVLVFLLFSFPKDVTYVDGVLLQQLVTRVDAD